MRLHKDVEREDHFCSSWTMQLQKNNRQPHNPLEPCRARIVPIFGGQVVPSLVITGETTDASGAKLVARAQHMSVLPGFILLSVLLFQ